ncbi:hypothetical protein QFZ87_000876 [Bacillus sp. SLBN-46]|nr:hypothetical protein [Bacillus sp. SLBN-46]
MLKMGWLRLSYFYMELNDKNNKINLGEYMRPVDYRKFLKMGGKLC